jgi:hypothetical protein
MQWSMSARDRRTLVIGGSVVGSLLAIGRGGPALLEWQASQRGSAQELGVELNAARAARAGLSRLRDSLGAQRARVAELDSTMLGAETASAAAAQLASTLEDLADDAHVKVGALQLRADSASASPVTEVAVRLTAVADVYGLLALMRSIEGGDLLLTIRELSVSQPDPGAPDGKPETLRVDMTVGGLARLAPGKAHDR